MRLMFSVMAIVGLTVGAFGAEKETPPSGSDPKPFKLPVTDDFTLPNKMQVTLVQYGVVPKVAIRAFVDAGAMRQAQDRVWISKLTAQLMKEGTATRSGEQLASEVADMGGQLEITSELDSLVAGSTVLSDHGSQFVELLADVLANAKLPESEFPRLKKDLVRDLAVTKSEPGSLAAERFYQTVYPGQPYGRLFPTNEQLSSYKPEDARIFFNDNFSASRTHLYVVGKFDPAIKDAIKHAFASWKQGQSAPVPPPRAITQYSLQRIDRPGAAQSTVYIGLPVAGPQSPDYLTLDVMDSLLGGSFGSRITTNIREDKGYTYSPYSFVGEAGHDSYWVEVADVTTAVTGPSLREIISEVKRLRKDPPSEQELKGIQNYLAGVFVLKNTASADAVIRQLHFVDVQELDRSFLFTYVQKIQAVSPRDIQRIAETYITPSKMTVVVVGDQTKVADQLKAFETAPE